jgi:hypothetical protein
MEMTTIEDLPLKELVHCMSQNVENIFNEDGELAMCWLVEARGEEPGLIVTPIQGSNPAEARAYKQGLAAMMRKFFQENGVTRYALAFEGWSSKRSEDQNRRLAAGGSLADEPDRREVILISADDGHEQVAAMREIIRPQHGKPYLTKLEFMEGARGMFWGLLSRPVMTH